jgi:hypothetical protein
MSVWVSVRMYMCDYVYESKCMHVCMCEHVCACIYYMSEPCMCACVLGVCV